MTEFKTVDDILNYAIDREQEAADFYKDLSDKMERPWMKAVFEDFAREEKGHKAKLEAIKKGELLVSIADKVQDLKIGDYLVEVSPDDGELDYQKALVIAMKREKASFKLYSDLAAKTDDENVKQTFLTLAQEEAKHKLRFEVEYDDLVLTEN